MPSSASRPPVIVSLSLHDALPILDSPSRFPRDKAFQDSPGTLQIVIGLSSNCRLTAHRRLVVTNAPRRRLKNEQSLAVGAAFSRGRSEEHTSELQSLRHLVCRLLLRAPL